MTPSNGNIFRVAGHLCGEFVGPGEFPTQRPVTQSFDVFLDLRPNKRLSKHSWGWWFEMPSCPLWRHCNDSYQTMRPWGTFHERVFPWHFKFNGKFVLAWLHRRVSYRYKISCPIFHSDQFTTIWIRAELNFHRIWIAMEQGKSEGFDSCDRPSNLKLDSNRQFFRPCDREIWRMTLQYNRAPLLCYFKLCASFRSHWWIQTSITVRKRPIWVKFDDF